MREARKIGQSNRPTLLKFLRILTQVHIHNGWKRYRYMIFWYLVDRHRKREKKRERKRERKRETHGCSKITMQKRDGWLAEPMEWQRDSSTNHTHHLYRGTSFRTSTKLNDWIYIFPISCALWSARRHRSSTPISCSGQHWRTNAYFTNHQDWYEPFTVFKTGESWWVE